MIGRLWRGLRSEFWLSRWNTHPYQMFLTFGLGVWSAAQLAVGNVSNGIASSPLGDQVEQHSQILISSANLFGAIICLVGLHMRDLESATYIEVIGYLSLVGTLMIYISLVAADHGTWLYTGYGYCLAWMFVCASVFRTIQIFLLKRAEGRARNLQKIVDKVLEPGGDYVDG